MGEGRKRKGTLIYTITIETYRSLIGFCFLQEMEARRAQARQWRDQQVRELSSLPQRSSQQEEQLRALRLEREFERRAQEAEQEDEDGEKVCIHLYYYFC